MLQIIFAGPVETEVIVDGTIVGQRSIPRVAEARPYPFLDRLFKRDQSKSPHSRRAMLFIFGWITVILGVVFMMLLAWWGSTLERVQGDKSARFAARLMASVVFALFLSLGLYALMLGSMTPEPPFEF